MNLSVDCSFKLFTNDILNASAPFDCGLKDLDDFFRNDALAYAEQLLGRTYCFVTKGRKKAVVSIFTVSNSSIKVSDLPNNARRHVNAEIPWVKQGRNYPAVLVGRLGVNKDLKRSGVGSQTLNFIKAWFVNPKNKTGCRYVVVDAYNTTEALDFYKKNDFRFMFKDENIEKQYFGIAAEKTLKTRFMYFDLIKIC